MTMLGKRLRKALLSYLPNVAKTVVLRRLPALYRIFEIRPTSCNIMLTNRCNLRCVMCGQWRGEAGGELTTAGWQLVIDDLKENGFANIHFTGGEPLLRDDLAKLVSYAVGRGFTVGLTTNGTLMSADRLRELLSAGLRSIALSIDALDDNYALIRGVKGAYRKVVDAAHFIAQARRERGIDAYINFTLMRESRAHFAALKRFADDVDIPVGICLLDKVSSIFDIDENEGKFWIEDVDSAEMVAFLGLLRNEAAQRPHTLLIDYPGIDFISAYFRDPRQGRIPCVISQDRIFIGPAGDLFGGCLAMGAFGNVTKEAFAVISSSDRYRRAKRKMFYKQCPGCSCGYMFNIRHMPELVLRNAGRLLAERFRGMSTRRAGA